MTIMDDSFCMCLLPVVSWRWIREKKDNDLCLVVGYHTLLLPGTGLLAGFSFSFSFLFIFILFFSVRTWCFLICGG